MYWQYFIHSFPIRAMDFPAKSLAALSIIKCGRRWPYIICLVGSGVSFLVMLAFNRGDYANDWPIVTCAMCGNFFISTSFAIIWVYTAELFPTNVRYVRIYQGGISRDENDTLLFHSLNSINTEYVNVQKRRAWFMLFGSQDRRCIVKHGRKTSRISCGYPNNNFWCKCTLSGIVFFGFA